ncbi:MAG: hypothetical protein KDC33_11100 [Thermoleophilia bacterium]|nr:hypothetical protein [Thermoleophilia bacterium]
MSREKIDDPRVQVAVQTPNDPDAPGHGELQAIGEGGDDRPAVADLARRAWLTQDGQARGARLATVGLEMYAAHPELEMQNVPTMFLEGAVRLLKEIAGYALAGGRLTDGDVMQMRDSLPCLVGFAEAEGPGGHSVMRVMLLA